MQKSTFGPIVKAMLDPKEWCGTLKYSPNEKLLACASNDKCLYVYDVMNKYSLRHTLTGHASNVTSFDWSVNSDLIWSICGGYDLLYFSIYDQTPAVATNNNWGPTIFRDTDWASQSNKFGWAVQGIFPIEIGSDGGHINSVDSLFGSLNVLATGDDYGLVNVMNYPCLDSNR
jgi:WD40 repeat protein